MKNVRRYVVDMCRQRAADGVWYEELINVKFKSYEHHPTYTSMKISNNQTVIMNTMNLNTLAVVI